MRNFKITKRQKRTILDSSLKLRHHTWVSETLGCQDGFWTLWEVLKLPQNHSWVVRESDVNFLCWGIYTEMCKGTECRWMGRWWYGAVWGRKCYLQSHLVPVVFPRKEGGGVGAGFGKRIRDPHSLLQTRLILILSWFFSLLPPLYPSHLPSPTSWLPFPVCLLLSPFLTPSHFLSPIHGPWSLFCLSPVDCTETDPGGHGIQSPPPDEES